MSALLKKGQLCGVCIFSLMLAWTSYWTSGRVACDLRRHGARVASLHFNRNVYSTYHNDTDALADSLSDLPREPHYSNNGHKANNTFYLIVSSKFLQSIFCPAIGLFIWRLCFKEHAQQTHTILTLQWRHDERDGVSTYQPHDSLLNRLFRHRWKKTPKLRVTGLSDENSTVTGEFPAQRAISRKMFPFDDVTMPDVPRILATPTFSFCVRCGLGLNQLESTTIYSWLIDKFSILLLNQSHHSRGKQINDDLFITHWDRDKMAAIFQTICSNAFSWMKCINFDQDFIEVCS